nr:MAG TPA: RNA-dependent RNA polymerase [Caudoviricetes sp.]
MAKQKTTQQFVFKINSTLLAKNNWDLTLPLERARRVPGLVVSLGDSQILTWINQLNGTTGYDIKAKNIKKEIKYLKQQPNCKENKKKITDLYKNLYDLQFKKDYVSLIIDKQKDYDRANEGFKINGISYKRLLCTTNGVKTSTVVYASEQPVNDSGIMTTMVEALKRRIENGRNINIPIVPAKLSAYEALCASNSVPVSWPKGIIVVKDCIINFKSDIINITDKDGCKDPVVEFLENQDVSNNCSDGCSMMLPSLARRWNRELTGDYEHEIGGCNLRCSWTKGMTFPFDYIRFAEEVVGASEENPEKYLIEDVWGTKRDVRDSELIITESQLKLTKSYSSWEDYYNNCVNNGYTIRIAKTAPHEVDNIRQLNYQFIQSLPMSDNDIEELIYPTISEIKNIVGMDVDKTIAYLCGSGFDSDSIEYADTIAKVLMIEPKMISDAYIQSKIKKMIERRIRDAKIGVLDVHGNFQIISGDLYALCESMFGMKPNGMLKAGELYSKYWKDCGVKKVLCARAPMSNIHSLMSQNICYDDKVADWYKYMPTVVVVNGYDTMPAALNGFDQDGDLLFTTDNEPMLRNQSNIPALFCPQKNANKIIAFENDVIKANKAGFGSKIGSITNRITAMTSLMANYEPGSKEYETLRYRTQCGQKLQQEEIDKAKGIIPVKMNPEWYVWSANKIDYDNDSEEEIERKKFNKKICAHKKPYFFQYNYLSLKRDYDKYVKISNENAVSIYKKTLDEILHSDSLTEEEIKFVENYKRNLPLDESPSVMNKICWAVERETDNLNFCSVYDYSCYDLYSGSQYNHETFDVIKIICDGYRSAIKKESKNILTNNESSSEFTQNTIDVLDYYIKEMHTQCPNEETLCDILIDLCYGGLCKEKYSKEILWYACGNVIVDRLLKSNNYKMRYPVKSDNPDFICCGTGFEMKEIIYKDGDDDEFFI